MNEISLDTPRDVPEKVFILYQIVLIASKDGTNSADLDTLGFHF